MTQWDTYEWDFPHGKHPCVVFSDPELCGNPDIKEVNVFGCSTHRARRQPGNHEALLDSADGMDWETLCRLDRIFLAPKAELQRRRGTVTPERRRQMGRKIIRVFGLLPA